MKRPDLGAWRNAHHRNPIVVRPLRFLREQLTIVEGKSKRMHPDFERVVMPAARLSDGRALQMMAQRVNVLGPNSLRV